MTTINARIKKIRKEAGLNQKEFSEILGVTQSGVSYMEQDGRNVSDMTIKGICNHFKVNEDWLRDGTEPMRIESSTFSLEEFVKEHGGGELEIETLKAYFELEPDIRQEVIKEFIRSRIGASRDEFSKITVKEAEAAYIKSRSNHVQATGQSALNTSADTENQRKNENAKKTAAND